MFGLKNILDKTFSGSVKTIASGNFLDAINKINDTTIKERNDKRLEESNELFYKAKSKLDQCISTNNLSKTKLREISILFVKSIELNRSNQEAYLYLSKIFYILGNKKLSIKYLKIAKTIYNNEDTEKLSEVLSKDEIRSDKNIIDTKPDNVEISQKLRSGSNFPSSKPSARTSIFNHILRT